MSIGPYRLLFFRTLRGACPAAEFLESLSDKAQAKAGRWLEQLKLHGPDLHRPMADVVSGPIRELRVSFGKERYRFLFFVHGRSVVVTHGFRKKSGKIHPREIKRAARRRLDWLAGRTGR